MSHTVLLEKSVAIVASSNPATGALNVDSSGGAFEISLETPLNIPKQARNVTVAVEQASIWYTVPNLTKGVDTAFSITVAGTPYLVVCETGLYSLSSLQTSIESLLINAGCPPNSFQFISDSATQKVLLRLNGVGTSVDFSVVNSCRVILGFPSAVVGPNTALVEDYLATDVAAFNQYNAFEIHSSLTEGLVLNGKYSGLVSIHPITTSPGTLLVAEPFRPAVANAPELAGTALRRIKFWLNSDANDDILDTLGETWSFRLRINYHEPVEVSPRIHL